MTKQDSGDRRHPKWVRDLVEEWRERLIPDWLVILSADAPDEGRAGSAQAHATYRRITLWLDLDPSHYVPNEAADYWKRDLEEVIVHELLHAPVELILDAYRPARELMSYDGRKLVERTADLAEEQHIEAVARALVSLKYGEPSIGRLRIATTRAEQ